MAETGDLVAAGGVLLIFITVMVYNYLQTARGPRVPSTPSGHQSPQASALLGRYASHRGHVVGEVVAVTMDRIILRQGGTHKAVPLSQARLREGEVALEGDIDWMAAEDAGRAWAGEGKGTA